MIALRPFGIIFVAPTTWSTKSMSENLKTSVDPFLELVRRKLRRRQLQGGHHHDLSIDHQEARSSDGRGMCGAFRIDARSGRTAGKDGAAESKARRICPHNLARRFAEHLIDIGVAQPGAADGDAGRACGIAGGLRGVSRQAARPQPAKHPPHGGLRSTVPHHRFGEATPERAACVTLMQSASRACAGQLASRQDGDDPCPNLPPISIRMWSDRDQSGAERSKRPSAGARDCRDTCRPMASGRLASVRDNDGTVRGTMRCCCSWHGSGCARPRSSRSSSTNQLACGRTDGARQRQAARPPADHRGDRRRAEPLSS